MLWAPSAIALVGVKVLVRTSNVAGDFDAVYTTGCRVSPTPGAGMVKLGVVSLVTSSLLAPLSVAAVMSGALAGVLGVPRSSVISNPELTALTFPPDLRSVIVAVTDMVPSA